MSTECSQFCARSTCVLLEDLGGPDAAAAGESHGRGHAPVTAVGTSGAGDDAQHVRAVADLVVERTETIVGEVPAAALLE